MTRENDFTKADLFALRSCLRDFDILLSRYPDESQDIAVRYSLVKTFELTYEMATKTLNKYLQYNALGGAEVQNYNLQDLIRFGDQEGLLRSGWPEWKRYRESRGRTVHAYHREVLLTMLPDLKEFSVEAHALLNNLERSVEDDA